MTRLWHGIRLAVAADRGLAGRFLLTTVLVGAIPVSAAWLTKTVLDGLQAGAAVPDLVPAVLGLGVATVLLGALTELIQFDKRQLERTSRVDGQERIFGAVSRLQGIARFEDPAYLDRLSLAIGMGREAPARILEGCFAVVQAAITVGSFVAVLIGTSPVMAALVALSVTPVVVCEWRYARRRAALTEDNGHAHRREMFYSQLLTEPRAAQEIRLFGIGAYLRGLMRLETSRIVTSEHQLDRREVGQQTAFAVGGALLAAGSLWWAVVQAGRGALSVGDVTLFVAAVAGVQGAMASLVAMAGSLRESCLLLDSYTDILATRSDLSVAPDAVDALPLATGIHFENVWFRYSPDGPWVLQGLDLTIDARSSVALVGPNGAGKSTVVKLLCRLYDPERGRITWDGTDLRDLAPESLRARLSAVFQDFMHYDLTATQNIGLGDLTALDDPARVRAAASSAGVHRRLESLPHGYDTLLSRMYTSEADKDDPSTGIVLSGGQWQRVALARAFLRRDCDLMVLDEPGSGLDADAEAALTRELTQHSRGRTTVHISHRLGALRNCDRIVVLEEGRVSESGTHTGLMAAAGTYARLFEVQARGYRGGDGDRDGRDAATHQLSPVPVPDRRADELVSDGAS